VKPVYKKLLIIALFSVAMGFLETAVVVYLREIYYPKGFCFPIEPFSAGNAITEIWREAATIIMLYTIGYLSGRNKPERFAYFIFCFGIWDIFYYVFLKALLNWPESFFTWDILFLIPVPWIGPVLAPCLVSLLLIIWALLIIYYTENGKNAKLKAPERWLLLIGCLIIIFSFIRDYIIISRANGNCFKSMTTGRQSFFNELSTYIPQNFPWWIFCIGFAVMLVGVGKYFGRMRRANR